MTLKTPPEAGSHLSQSDCDFWDAHGDLSVAILTILNGGSPGMSASDAGSASDAPGGG
jgi:hypothetical protein